jgi:hypothetical protein
MNVNNEYERTWKADIEELRNVMKDPQSLSRDLRVVVVKTPT